MTKKVPAPMGMEEWTDKFALHIVSQMNTLIKSQEKTAKVQFAPDLEERVITQLIRSLVMQCLTYRPKGLRKDDLEAYIGQAFAQLKVQVQDAVSAGFKTGVADYSGQDIDYYCLVRVFKEPDSKLSN